MLCTHIHTDRQPQNIMPLAPSEEQKRPNQDQVMTVTPKSSAKILFFPQMDVSYELICCLYLNLISQFIKYNRKSLMKQNVCTCAVIRKRSNPRHSSFINVTVTSAIMVEMAFVCKCIFNVIFYLLT